MQGRRAARPVGDPDEVVRVHLQHVEGTRPFTDGEVDGLAGPLGQALERRPSRFDEGDSPDREPSEPCKLRSRRKAVAHAAHEASALERGEQPGDRALVHPQLGRELGDAEILAALVEGREDCHRLVGGLHVAHCATHALIAQPATEEDL